MLPGVAPCAPVSDVAAAGIGAGTGSLGVTEGADLRDGAGAVLGGATGTEELAFSPGV